MLGFGRDGDDHGVAPAQTTSTPCSVNRAAVGVVEFGVGDERVDARDRREADEVLPADLAGVGGDHDVVGGAHHRTFDGGLLAVRRGQAVPHADGVGADEGDVDADRIEHAKRLLSDGGLGHPAYATAEQLQRHRVGGGQPGGDGHGVRDDDELAVGRQQGRDARRRGAGVQQQRAARAGHVVDGGSCDRVLEVGAGGLPFADSGLDEVQGTRGHCAAVDSSHHAGLVEGGQVPTHGLGGDVVGLGELGDRCATLADHQCGDRLLALFGVHASPYVWEIRGWNVDICCFTPDCVDLSMISCNLAHMSTSPSTTSQPIATALAAGTVLQGVPAVAGVQYAPVIRPGARPRVDPRRRAHAGRVRTSGRGRALRRRRGCGGGPTAGAGRDTPPGRPRRSWLRRRRWLRTGRGSARRRSGSRKAARRSAPSSGRSSSSSRCSPSSVA